MKKVFLFLTASLFGVAAMAGNTWELDEVSNEIEILWNEYGSGKTDENADGSYQWQAGNTDVLPDATGNTSWVPALGEKFMVTLTATPDFSADKVQMFIVDEREEAGYWAALSSATGETKVVEGEEFTFTKVFNIDNVSKVTGDGNAEHQKGSEVEGGLTLPGLIIAIEKPNPHWSETATRTDKSGSPCVFKNVKLDILYAEAGSYENPFELTYGGPADKEEDGYKYQGEVKSAVTAAEVGQYVNVIFSGIAISAVKSIMYALVDGSAAASYWTAVTEMTTFATDIEKGQEVNFTFSIPVTVATPAATPDFKDVFMAQDPNQEMSKVFDNYSISSNVDATPEYVVPTAIETIAAEDAIVNGVIYANSIVISNTAGQVLAKASGSFEIASLPAGVYFAQTEKGSFSFVK